MMNLLYGPESLHGTNNQSQFIFQSIQIFTYRVCLTHAAAVFMEKAEPSQSSKGIIRHLPRTLRGGRG